MTPAEAFLLQLRVDSEAINMAKCCFALLILSIIAFVATRENLEQLKLEEPSKLVYYICLLSKDLRRVDKNPKTIAIIKFDTEIPDRLIDDVGQCISKDISVVVMDYKKKEVPLAKLKVSLVILMTDVARRVRKMAF